MHVYFILYSIGFQNSSQPNKGSSNKSAKKGKSDTSALLNNSFVPLQVVKSHITKSNKQKKEGQKENVQNLENASEMRTKATKVITYSFILFKMYVVVFFIVNYDFL